MRVYFACGPYLNYVDQLRIVQETTGINPFPVKILISYLDVRRRSLDPLFTRYFKPGDVELFLDSGAFGAFTRKILLDVREYGEWIKRNQHWIHVYANLDVKHSASETAKNQKILEGMGLNPLPVYHGNEPFQVFKDLCQEYDYVCLGGVAGMARMQGAYDTLRRCSEYALSQGTKIHMFGVGTHNVLSRIQFYSADSTSFIQSRYGRVVVWDERTMSTKKIKYRSPELIKYEHLLTRYGLPTAPLFMRRPGKFGNQIIRAFEYLQFQRMTEWLDAIWKVRHQKGLIKYYAGN